MTEVNRINEFFSNFGIFECVFKSLTYLHINNINIELIFSLGSLNEIGDKFCELLEDRRLGQLVFALGTLLIRGLVFNRLAREVQQCLQLIVGHCKLRVVAFVAEL